MRLLFDARYTRKGFHDGISRFGSELLGAVLAQAPARGIEVLAMISDPEQLTMLPAGVRHVLMPAPTSPAEPLLALRINRLRPDVVFSPMQTMGSLGRRFGLILTLHDLIYYDHPEPPHDLPAPIRLGWRLYHRAYWPQRLVLDRADAIATVSATTAERIAEHRLTSRPVHIIPNAPTPPQRLSERTNGHEARSIVYMGAFLPYKNAEALIAAMAELPGYTLHLLSRITPARRAQLSAGIPAGARVEFHGGVSDERYIELIDSATALVSASRAEGYGLPLVEAMVRGCPVVVSDLPIFQEIGGAAARYFHPDDPSEIARRVRELEDEDAWRRASAASCAQANTFTWADSAHRLLDLAEEIAPH